MDMIGGGDVAVHGLSGGGTLTSQADGKSSTNALGKVHDDTVSKSATKDAKQLASSISRDVIGH